MKKLIIGLVVFLLIALIAVVTLPFLFKDKIIAAAQDAANQELNATLKIEDLDVSILQNIQSFPDISLIAKNITIVGKDSFAGDTLLNMDKLALALDIKTFFNAGETMKINGISLSDAKIYAYEKADGLVNWDIVKKKDTKEEPSKFSLSIKDIALQHIDIIYKSNVSNQRLDIHNLTHKGKGDFTENNLNYDQSSTIESMSFSQGIVPYLKNVKLKNESKIAIDQAAKKYTFSNNEIHLNDLKLMLNGFVQNLSDGAMNMDLNFESDNTNFKDVLSLIPALYSNQFSDIKANGKFDLKGKINGTYFKTIYPKMDIDFNIANADFQYPSLPKKVSNIQVKSKITSSGGSADNVMVDVSDFKMNIGSDPFQGRLKVSQMISNPTIELYSKGKLNLADIKSFYPMEDVKQLEGMMNLDLNIKAKKSDIDAKNYNAIQASGIADITGLNYESKGVEKPVKVTSLKLKFSPQYVDMSECIGGIGETDFDMKGKLENFLGYYLSKEAVMKGNLHFMSHKVNANEFLSESNEKKNEYVLVPKNIDFTGSVDIKEMLYGKMNIQNLSGSMNVADEKVALKDIHADLLGGKAIMNATYNTKGIDKPITTVNYNIQNFDMKQTFDYMESAQKLAPIMQYMVGSISSESNLTMQLLPDMSPDLNTLNGDFNIAIPATKVVNLPMLSKVAEVTKLTQLNNLELNNIKTKMSFVNGRAIVQPFAFKAADLNMGVQGSQGLDKSLDYTMAVDVPFSKLGNAASVVNGLISKFKIPFIGNVNPETVRLNLNIKGFFDKPAVSLGKPELLSGGKTATADVMLKDAATNTINDAKNAALQKADSLKNALQSEAQKKADELKKQAEDKANELKKQAEDEVNKKKDDLLKEIKKKLPW